MSCSSLLITAAVVLVLYQAVQKWRRSNRPPLPPGPRPLPIVGNIMDLPPKGTLEYLHWLKLREQHGPICSITVLGQTMILLSDRDAVTGLLDRNGAKNSSRPWLEFSFGMCGFGDLTVGLPYGDTMRLHRKLMSKHLGAKTAVDGTRRYHEIAVGLSLERMLDTPHQLFQHMRSQSASLILQLTYGYSVDTTKRDPFQYLAHQLVVQFSESCAFGAYYVDLFPPLKHLAGWMPGSGFVHKARRFRDSTAEATNLPYEFVKRRMGSNMQKPSFVSNALSGGSKNPEYEKAVKVSAVMLFAGGYETTLSTLYFLWLALIKHPQVQRKVQAEIDGVVGTDRLPQLADRDRLPYLNAVIKEAYRWQPVAPLGMAHASDEEQVYRGYRIPKGAVLLPNIRWFSRDPSVYHDAEVFLPERFLAPFDEPDPKDYVFGFGRRVCPGRLFADASLFLTVAQTLAMFDLSKALDNLGNPVEPVLEIPAGLLSQPKEYPFRLAPRSHHQEQMIRENAATMKTQGGSDVKLLETYGLLPKM